MCSSSVFIMVAGCMAGVAATERGGPSTGVGTRRRRSISAYAVPLPFSP